MATSYPPDVIVLDTDGLLHARLARGRGKPRLLQAKSYSFRDEVFRPGVVTPELVGDQVLAEVFKRLRLETGRWDSASLLLPDPWFRINIVELPSLPDRQDEAFHAVRWALKRSLPIPPESLRVTWEVLGKSPGGLKLLVISALEETLARIERVFGAAGIEVVLIEPIGLNIWNAITIRESNTSNDRLFVYIRNTDFTTAVFRGSQPLFIRSRNLSGERTVQQEIRLSASYLRHTLQTASFERCYVAGTANAEVGEALSSEFGAPVMPVALRDMIEQLPSEMGAFEAELTACTGVFTS